jgi:hypothetical protein
LLRTSGLGWTQRSELGGLLHCVAKSKEHFDNDDLDITGNRFPVRNSCVYKGGEILMFNDHEALGKPLVFVYAPPDFGDEPYRYRRPQPPYPSAPAWKCSVYYYWYLYLKQNQDYQETCSNGGRGPCAKLYDDFGDIFSVDFKSWWTDRRHLFAEPPAVWRAHENPPPPSAVTATFVVDLNNKRSRILDELRTLLAEMQGEMGQERVESAARYPIATNPVLHSLHAHLVAWEFRKMNPTIHPSEVADFADIRVNQVVDGQTLETARINKQPLEPIRSEIRLRKLKALNRHLKIAEQYIQNAGLGRFPYRETR